MVSPLRIETRPRRLGLTDHVSRFNTKLGYREGWTLSTRFERSLQKLRTKVEELKDAPESSGRRRRERSNIQFV